MLNALTGAARLRALGCMVAALAGWSSAVGATPPAASASAPPAATAAALPGVQVAGVSYDAVIQLANTRLLLNGAGIRMKLVFKVYTAGLYLKGKAGTPEAVLAMPGPKQLRIVMLRDIDGDELGKLFIKGMENNSTPEQFGQAINGTVRIGQMFAQKKRLASGESFSIDWLPGRGTLVTIDGLPQGEPIAEPEFFSALMRIWLGPAPADTRLKEALLGR